MTPPVSKTHRIAILKQDNGELAEDVLERGEVEAATSGGASDQSERVVASGPVDEVPERPHPAAPVPGTLPRDAPEEGDG